MKVNDQDRRTEKVPNHSGIYRVLVKDKKTGRWVEPERGSKFYAARSVKRLDGTRKKVKQYFDTFAEARAFRTSNLPVDAALPALQGVVTSKSQGGLLFVDLLEKWKKDWLPHKAISTQIRYKSYLQHFEYFYQMPVEQIQPTDVDGWLAYLKRPEYLERFHSTRCDYAHEFSVLRRVFNFYGTRFNRDYRLPFIQDHRRMLTVRARPTVSKDLTVEEFQRFISKLREMVSGTKWGVVYYLALMQYGTYSRLQEVAALHYEDFVLSRNKITVNKKVIWARAKGMKPFLENGAKTDGGKEIPMSDLARKVFHEWVLKSGVRSGPLFQLEGKLLTYRQIEDRYTTALKAAGLPYSATHVLRHASLTEFYESCKDLLITQKVAGHRDLRATTRYTKVRDDKVIQGQLQMDRKLELLQI